MEESAVDALLRTLDVEESEYHLTRSQFDSNTPDASGSEQCSSLKQQRTRLARRHTDAITNHGVLARAQNGRCSQHLRLR